MPTHGSNTGPFGVPPGGPYFVFPPSGTIQRQSDPALAEGLAQTGWVGFATMADAKAYIAANPITKGKNVVRDVTHPLSNVNDFLSRLTEKSTWIRVGEVVLGLILIAVGLARITHAVPVATKIAKTVGAAGVMAA